MAKIIQVKLGEYRGVFYYDLPDEVSCNRNDPVVLEIERGLEYGIVVSDVNIVCKTKADPSQGKVARLLTADDAKRIEENKKKAKDALGACVKKTEERKLDMQIVQCEYTLDGSKVIFFFTSEGRVDFRDLVKDLARVFRVRIELKQIGVRDKAKVVGGIGICGRELCCSSYMKGFHPLSIKMSKEQGLPLNPSRISGVCGRIKCCMAYEYQVYREYARDLPRAGDKITTTQGKGKVIDVNILKRYASVDLGEGKYTKVTFGPLEPAKAGEKFSVKVGVPEKFEDEEIIE